MEAFGAVALVGIACALFALSGVTVARFKGGTWHVSKVIMGMPVEWVFRSKAGRTQGQGDATK